MKQTFRKPLDFSKQERRILSERVAGMKGNTAKKAVLKIEKKKHEKKVAEFKAILTEGLEE